MTAAAFSIPRITHARNVSEAESTPLDVAALFEASSPDVLALAKRVMEKSSKFASADSNASTIGIGASATSTTTAGSPSVPTPARCNTRNGKLSTMSATWTA